MKSMIMSALAAAVLSLIRNGCICRARFRQDGRGFECQAEERAERGDFFRIHALREMCGEDYGEYIFREGGQGSEGIPGPAYGMDQV